MSDLKMRTAITAAIRESETEDEVIQWLLDLYKMWLSEQQEATAVAIDDLRDTRRSDMTTVWWNEALAEAAKVARTPRG